MASIANPPSYVKGELEKHFHIAQYDQIKKNGKHFIFHFLISSEQPDRGILDWIQTCNAKYADYINKPDTLLLTGRPPQGEIITIQPTGFCPLHLAVLTEREPVVGALCDSPYIDCEKPDVKGWTALQHAIARNHPGILAKVEAAIDAHDKGGGVESKGTTDKVDWVARQRFPFLRSLLRPQIPKDDEIVVRFLDEKGVIRPMTQREFRERNQGAQFYEGFIATPDALFRNWLRRKSQDPIEIWLGERYSEFKQKKPLLLLSHEGLAGFGIRAGEPLKGGQIATLYGSEFISPDEKAPDPYSYETTSGARVRNFGPIINDGYPNVHHLTLPIDGVETGMLVCLNDVKEQEQLLSNYGVVHPVKWGPRVELGMKEILRDFPHSDSLYKEWLKVLRRREDDSFEYERRMSGLLYILSTPSTLLSLCLKGHFDLDSVEAVLKDPKVVKLALGQRDGVGNPLQTYYFNALNKIRELNQKVPDGFKKQVLNEIADRFAGNVRAAYFALRVILCGRSSLKSLEDWKSKFNELFIGAEALISFLESRAKNPEEAWKVFCSLSSGEQIILFDLSKNELGFTFPKSPEDYKLALAKLEEFLPKNPLWSKLSSSKS